MDVLLKKYGSSHALWFRVSQSFLLLEEPAFDVFMLLQEGIDRTGIIDFCRDKYGHIEHRIAHFVDEISALLQHYNSPAAKKKISQKHLLPADLVAPVFEESIDYRIGTQLIRISYGSVALKWAIHPLQAHLAINTEEPPDHEIECFLHGEILVFRYRGQVVEAFQQSDFEYYTGNIKQLLYSLVYGKDFFDWMAMLHASGIEKDGEAILFSAAAGSGKTTISALLKAQGYGYLSDDFIATDAQGHAYPFPAAISVKEGSVPLLSGFYPELLQTSPEETFIGKMVRYLPVFNLDEKATEGFRVKAFVFIDYSADKEFKFEPVEKHKALQLLLKETWVNPQEKFVGPFFDWVEQTPFFSLRYKKTEEALRIAKQIFELK